MPSFERQRTSVSNCSNAEIEYDIYITLKYGRPKFRCYTITCSNFRHLFENFIENEKTTSYYIESKIFQQVVRMTLCSSTKYLLFSGKDKSIYHGTWNKSSVAAHSKDFEPNES